MDILGKSLRVKCVIEIDWIVNKMSDSALIPNNLGDPSFSIGAKGLEMDSMVNVFVFGKSC